MTRLVSNIDVRAIDMPVEISVFHRDHLRHCVTHTVAQGRSHRADAMYD
jgi:hypothetical protein